MSSLSSEDGMILGIVLRKKNDDRGYHRGVDGVSVTTIVISVTMLQNRYLRNARKRAVLTFGHLKDAGNRMRYYHHIYENILRGLRHTTMWRVGWEFG